MRLRVATLVALAAVTALLAIQVSGLKILTDGIISLPAVRHNEQARVSRHLLLRLKPAHGSQLTDEINPLGDDAFLALFAVAESQDKHFDCNGKVNCSPKEGQFRSEKLPIKKYLEKNKPAKDALGILELQLPVDSDPAIFTVPYIGSAFVVKLCAPVASTSILVSVYHKLAKNYECSDSSKPFYPVVAMVPPAGKLTPNHLPRVMQLLHKLLVGGVTGGFGSGCGALADADPNSDVHVPLINCILSTQGEHPEAREELWQQALAMNAMQAANPDLIKSLRQSRFLDSFDVQLGLDMDRFFADEHRGGFLLPASYRPLFENVLRWYARVDSSIRYSQGLDTVVLALLMGLQLAPCYNLHSDLEGDDLAVYTKTSIDLCPEACKAMPACRGWSFSVRGRICHLKSSITAEKDATGIHSGLRGAVEFCQFRTPPEVRSSIGQNAAPLPRYTHHLLEVTSQQMKLLEQEVFWMLYSFMTTHPAGRRLFDLHGPLLALQARFKQEFLAIEYIASLKDSDEVNYEEATMVPARAFNWFLSGFARQLKPDTAVRIWDVLLLKDRSTLDDFLLGTALQLSKTLLDAYKEDDDPDKSLPPYFEDRKGFFPIGNRELFHALALSPLAHPEILPAAPGPAARKRGSRPAAKRPKSDKGGAVAMEGIAGEDADMQLVAEAVMVAKDQMRQQDVGVHNGGQPF